MLRLRERATRILVAADALASLVAGCRHRDENSERAATAVEPTCSSALAISVMDLHGGSLPPRTLSLSFDDGPGARTAELSSYLAAQGIAASFFVNGKMLTGGTAILQRLVDDGHFVGNHTQTHTSLTGRATGGLPLDAAAIVSEVSQTDVLIAPFVTSNRYLFRAPYGDFDVDTAAAINGSPMQKYVGPINWDIGDHMGVDQAADWDCWTVGVDGLVLTPEQCGDLYLSEIDRVGHGTVLLHDPYFVDDEPTHGGTVDMIRYIVPILKAKGYAFARIDHVPEIAALLPALPGDAGLEAATAVDAGNAEAGAPAITPGSSGPSAPPSSPCPPSPQRGSKQ